MLRFSRSSLLLLGGLAVGLVGCSSSRIDTRRASMPPAGVERTVSTDHLLRVADILEQQQQTQRARELYQEILRREPGHPVAAARLNPPGVSHTSTGVVDSNAAVDRTEVTAPNRLNDIDKSLTEVAPPKLPTPTAPKFPAVEVEDVPEVKEPPADTKSAPSVPGKLTPGEIPKAPGVSEANSDSGKSGEIVASTVATGRSVVSSTLRTTTVVKPSESVPQLKPVPETNTKPVALPEKLGSEPTLQIMPRSKSGVRAPLQMRSRTPLVAGLDEPEIKVTALELSGMVAGLMHQKSNTRAVAAFVIGRLGKSGRPAVPHLERALTNEKFGPVQVRLAEAIARLDAENSSAFVMIADALRAEDYKTRWEAVCAADVANRGSADARRETVKRLIELLDDLNPKLRSMAALKLGEFGPAATPALPALTEAARKGDLSLRTAATASLAVLQPGVLPPTAGE